VATAPAVYRYKDKFVSCAITEEIVPVCTATEILEFIPLNALAEEAVVAVVADVALVAVEAFPLRDAVIVPAEKLPEASRNTI
jgi:hypothetical protein